MSEFKRPASEAAFSENFSQIKPLMSQTEAYYESSRCLFCYDAPCIKACPTGIDIPLFIRQINSKNELGAAKTIYNSNYFGYACGKVCPTSELCEGACVYTNTDVKPIEIGRLQSFATGKAISSNKKFYAIPKSNGMKVAVIGAGPAGISCACELRQDGFEVDIFEAKENPSGLTVHGVAPYKITNEEALDEMEYLQKQFGYTVHYSKTIDSGNDIRLLEENYAAIFIGIGLGGTSDLKIKGEELENVFGAVEFVQHLRMNHHKIVVPEKVIVLGGGNTAMDAASESARMGASEVILAYRRSKEEKPAYEFEYDLAKEVGVKGIFNVAPMEILGKDGKVAGVKFIRTETINGKPSSIEGSEFIEDCDWVIKATGQSKQIGFLERIEGIQLNANGTIAVNDHFQTSNKKYFAAGDAVSGGEEVVNAVANGTNAAIAIKNYLGVRIP
ncbi:MAG: FAD-dependent oxidoreductase [Chitinophagaceae bacterium]|nr:FAD-dependent oxidoreductase [Chitinophagaceae bacterium]